MLVGVLGGGQLGRMLGLAGVAMGLRFRFLDPSPDAPAKDVGELVVGDFEDSGAIDRFVAGLDVATFEFENVPAAAVRRVAERVSIHPNARALEVAQDRVGEKTFFERAGLGVHPWAGADDLAGLRAGLARVGVPAVLKTRRGGYDGKGQSVIRGNPKGAQAGGSCHEEAEAAWRAIGQKQAIVEAMVPFTRELSIIAVRGSRGEFAVYPLVENRHAQGILRESRAPAAGVSKDLEQAAHTHCHALMDAMDYVGVLAVEFFEHEGRLLANEMAPRVHNSGHWTIEGAATSQFENHLRAILGWPLGSCAAHGASVMHNIIGQEPEVREVLAVPGAHWHWYGKEPRAGRKVGHVTVCGEDAAGVKLSSDRTAAIIERSTRG